MLLKIEGTITGEINDTPVKACAAGFLDTGGNSLNHFELCFIGKVPPNFNPIAAGNCWNSSYHPNALKPLRISERTPSNLFAMSSGTYATSRSVRFPTLDKSNYIDFKSEVLISDGIISTSSSTVMGRYNGPLDLLGVDDYTQVWRQGKDESTVAITITAQLLRATGTPLPIEIQTTYSGLSRRIENEPQYGRHFYGNQTWTGSVMSFDWVGILHL